MKQGDTTLLHIERAADQGRGIAHLDGQAVFVSNALPGEELLARIDQVEKRVAFATGLELRSAPSPERAAPFCPLYLSCGGCDMQHMRYACSTAQKQQTLADALSRIGGFAQGSYDMLPLLAMEQPLAYRNKVVFAVAGTPGKAEIGFYEKRSHRLIKAAACPLQAPHVEPIATQFIAWMNAHRVAPYDPATRDGIVRGLMIRSNQAGECLAIPIVARQNFPGKDALVSSLQAACPALQGIVLNLNESKTPGEALGRKNIPLFGADHLSEDLLGVRFTISPHSFFQVNHSQASALFSRALALAAPKKHELLIDAYCGAGAIGLAMAGAVRQVIGIESVAPAVENAIQNAAENGIRNAEFHLGACEDILPAMVAKGLHPDIITLDPPRKGCDARLLHAVATAAPGRIVYVSCNPSTLARDLKYLCANGYSLASAQAVDMFPWAGHVETVVLLSHKHR